VGSNVSGADPKLKRYPYDPKKAKELAQAGYPNGRDVQLYYSAAAILKTRSLSSLRPRWKKAVFV
jgi:ABC-type transport system substrate-binding protein